MVIAELSILGSFLCFLYIFIKKACPLLMKSLDSYIENVKNQIESAEKLKDESTVALAKANRINLGIQQEVEDYKKRSEERIAKLEEENRQYLRAMREKAALSLNARLNAELSKQKEMLVDRLADLVVEKLSERTKQQSDEIDFSDDDLKKLVG